VTVKFEFGCQSVWSHSQLTGGLCWAIPVPHDDTAESECTEGALKDCLKPSSQKNRRIFANWRPGPLQVAATVVRFSTSSALRSPRSASSRAFRDEHVTTSELLALHAGVMPFSRPNFVFTCCKRIERCGDQVTGAAGPVFIAIATVLFVLGTLCFRTSLIV
jgi:hypothetical protein